MLYMEGEGVFEFERTASRLREMRAQTGQRLVTD
jgi:predicted ATPase